MGAFAQSYRSDVSVRTALAAAMWDVVNNSLDKSFFHERFFITLGKEHQDLFSAVLFPWLSRCKLDAQEVSQHAFLYARAQARAFHYAVQQCYDAVRRSAWWINVRGDVLCMMRCGAVVTKLAHIVCLCSWSEKHTPQCSAFWTSWSMQAYG